MADFFFSLFLQFVYQSDSSVSLWRIIRGYRELRGVKSGFKGVIRDYRPLKGVMGGYRGSQGNKRGYRGLQLVTGVTRNYRLV